MNEPSSFVKGSTQGCTTSKYDNPPYIPGVVKHSLSDHTICPSARHKSGLHYNLHSLYGHSELVATQMYVAYSYVYCLVLSLRLNSNELDKNFKSRDQKIKISLIERQKGNAIKVLFDIRAGTSTRPAQIRPDFARKNPTRRVGFGPTST